MLKLYTNTSLLTEKNRKHVFPLLFDLYYTKNDFLISHYSIVENLNDSDIVVIPLEYTHSLKSYKSIINVVLDKAKLANKPIWVYSGGDFGYSLQDKSIFNFRLGGFHGKLHESTIIMPSFINDPYDSNLEKSFAPLHKNKIPQIGFVGHAQGGFIKYIKEFLSFVKVNLKRILINEHKDYQSFYPSSIKRAKYLKLIQGSDKLESNFILRNKYRAGVKSALEKKTTTMEFYDNIYKNPYTFCMRGAGNFSVRFYETLAVGRIPILIKTDCRLPLSSQINWKNRCLIVEAKEVRNMEQLILNFHESLSEEEFIQLQINNRGLWEASLKRESFFKVIHDDFLTKLKLQDA
tara:strand:+ start:2432 stop:3478 length:1047 start_codon:yes stop_codon:yes gene_type:complete